MFHVTMVLCFLRPVIGLFHDKYRHTRYTINMKIQVEPLQEDCYYQELKPGYSMYVAYQVS